MMTHLDPKDNAPQHNPRGSEAGENPRKGDYLVGKYRPPVNTRWRPGQSGNPSGRPKGRFNLKTEVERIISKWVTVRDGEGSRRMTLIAANLLAHGVKGAKGDVRSAGLLINIAHKMGLLVQKDDASIGNAKHGYRQASTALIGAANKPRPSDSLLENLDLALLSRDEQIELSRLAEVVDLGGDITALSIGDFERYKHIVNKGRGKNVTPGDGAGA